MLHAPTSETKIEATDSKTQPVQLEQDWHQCSFGISGAYALNGPADAVPGCSSHRQQRQTLAGLQATVGNQAVLHILQRSQPVAHLVSLRPSQSMMVQRKCDCGGTPGPAGECGECEAKREQGNHLFQAKLKVSQPRDQYEQEADRVAEQVMRMSEPASLHINAVGRRLSNRIDKLECQPAIQRQGDQEPDEEAEAEQEEEEFIEAKRSPGNPGHDLPGIEEALMQNRVGGEPLPDSTRDFMEHRFGFSFANVRVHTNGNAAQMARAINAQAFTHGRNIYFGANHYKPDTFSGQQLLAHELTHVIQQSNETSLVVGPSPTSDYANPFPRYGANGTARLGLPDTGPEVRLRSGKVIQPSRAVFISTHGRQGYYRAAARFHREHGFPEPQRVGSIEEMLEFLVAMPRPIEWVRIVTHAVPAGIFLPLLRGGATSLFQEDMRLRRTFELEQELATEHPTVRGQVVAVPYHITPIEWVQGSWLRIDQSTLQGSQLLREIGLREPPRPETEMHSFFWWVLDREFVTARDGATGAYLFQMHGHDRQRVLQSIDRNIAFFRQKVIAGPYAHGIPMDVERLAPPENAGPRTPAQVNALETAIVDVARPLIDSAIAGGGLQARYVLPTPRYGTVQSALERGTYADNLLRVKYSIPNGAEIQIRGCRMGQNISWLESFRDFFGHGEEAQRSRPHVSAPRLFHFYGTRGRQSAEWLQERRRGSRIYPEDPRFEANIVHVR